MLVLGDAHADDRADRAALLAAYEDAGETIALQAGDLGHYDLPVPTWFVAGNDEDLDVVEALRRGEEPEGDVRNVTLLASDLADLGGLTVAGLSGNYAPTKYDAPRSELSGDRRRHFTKEDVDRLCERGAGVDVDVLVTHEAPHGLLYLGYDPGADPIDRLLSVLEPDLCLVGHFHRHTVEPIGGTNVVALAPAWRAYYRLDPERLTLEKYDTPAVGDDVAADHSGADAPDAGD